MKTFRAMRAEFDDHVGKMARIQGVPESDIMLMSETYATGLAKMFANMLSAPSVNQDFSKAVLKKSGEEIEAFLKGAEERLKAALAAID